MYDLKQIYWWEGMKKDIKDYVANCPNCQQVKEEHLKLGNFTKIIDVLTLKWEAINMDFLVGLPNTRRQHESISIIVDSITKYAHFIPVKSTQRVKDFAILLY